MLQHVHSGTSLSSSNANNTNIIHYEPPNGTHESTNQDGHRAVDGELNHSVPDCPPDALTFEEALSNVSEGLADEPEIFEEETNI